MKRTIWIIPLVVLALALSSCGNSNQSASQTNQNQQKSTTPPTQQAPTAQAEAGSNAAIFQEAMAGVETKVEKFYDGIPVPEKATIQTQRDEKVECITSMNVADTIKWFKDKYTSLGLIEVEKLTKESENSATLYWGGYPTGEAVIVKILKITPSSSKITIYVKNP